MSSGWVIMLEAVLHVRKLGNDGFYKSRQKKVQNMWQWWGLLISMLWSRQSSLSGHWVGFTIECSRKWTPYWRGSCAIIQIPAGMSRAGVRGGLFIFVQVALSMCIMQANEKILFALRSRFLVSAYSFIFLTKSKRYFILFPMYNLQIVGLSCWYAIWSSPFFDLLNSHFSSFIRIALQKIIQPCR